MTCSIVKCVICCSTNSLCIPDNIPRKTVTLRVDCFVIITVTLFVTQIWFMLAFQFSLLVMGTPKPLNETERTFILNMKQTVRQTSLHNIKVIVHCYTTRNYYNGKCDS